MILLYACIVLFAYFVCELIKIVALYPDRAKWAAALRALVEANKAADEERFERMEALCDYYDSNLNRRLWTPWWRPSAWVNYG